MQRAVAWRARRGRAVAALAVALAVAAIGCGDGEWRCDADQGSRYDLRVVRMTLDVSQEPTPVPEAEICPIVPSCQCMSVDENGRRSVRTEADLRMLLEVRAPGYLTTLATHLSGDTDRAAQLVLVDSGMLRVLAASVRERLDAERGHVGLRAAPGPGRDVTGATYTLRNLDTGETHPLYYTARGAPSLDATASDETGLAVAVNVAPGTYRVESDVFETCNVIDAGWPYLVEGRFRGLDFPVQAEAVTLLNALDCGTESR